MSSQRTWERLGNGFEAKASSKSGGLDTLHGVGGDEVSKTNDPMNTPFADSSSGFPKTVPDLIPGDQLFDMGDVVMHNATRKAYGILDSPEGMLVIERTGERAYMYRSIDGSDPRKWVRSQAEMEDGRFAIVQKRTSRR